MTQVGSDPCWSRLLFVLGRVLSDSGTRGGLEVPGVALCPSLGWSPWLLGAPVSLAM